MHPNSAPIHRRSLECLSAGAVLLCKPLTQGPAPAALDRGRARYSPNVGEEEFSEVHMQDSAFLRPYRGGEMLMSPEVCWKPLTTSCGTE